MVQKPLLFFPTKEIASRSDLNGRGGKYNAPSPARQGERLSPKFQQLFDTLNKKKIEVQQVPTGTDPEQVLVFETAGSVEDFANAVSRIGGLDWLGELDIEDIEPDEDFYRVDEKGKKEDKTLKGKLYFVFTNDLAMRQLLSLWKLWVDQGDFDVKKGDHRGKGKLKEVFNLLHDIRRWGVEDRFEETNLFEYWEEDLQLNPERVVRFEIELWFRKTKDKRDNAARIVSFLLQELGGKTLSIREIADIRYHGILAELPTKEIRKIILNSEIELVKCDSIMYFRPSGQVITKGEYKDDELQAIKEPRSYSKAEREPVIALLDGLPLSQHKVLKDSLIIDDPEGFEENYPVKLRKHGTAMSSLIINGDLNNNEEPISTPLYVRPIMRPSYKDPSNESVTEDRLLIDTFHIAIKRIFEGEKDMEAVAPHVKIINLSICDPDRLFYNFMSPWSRLLDWLSFKYRVLFVVSTGNHANDIQIDMNPQQFKDLSQIDREKFFFKNTIDNARNHRLMSPSESINCLTVGALHADNSHLPEYESRINPYSSLLPATYSAVGGYKRSIKPDLVYYGGRQMYDFHMMNNTILTPSDYKRPPGIKVAAPSSSLSDTLFQRGTSIATALITRSGYHCYEVLKQLNEDENIEIPSNLESVIIKAMLVHGCSWDVIGEEIAKRIDVDDTLEIKKIKSQLLGYGFPDLSKVKECTEQRATVIGFGELNENDAHIYKLPLPPSLSVTTAKRKLTVTLAWYTPISPATQKYRTARLWFETNSSVTPDRRKGNYDYKAVQRGTLQHEIFEGERAAAFVDGDAISIKVNCKDEAASFTDDIPYALIVSLEVSEGVDIPIYQEISERISLPVAIKQRE